jgi:GTPase
MDRLPKIALVGRANVGKSTLFNRLAEHKKAIISQVAGTTRDRHFADVSWRGVTAQLIDTGGLDIMHPKDIEKEIIKQTSLAIKEADLVMFLVDVKDGLMPQDKEVAKVLRQSKKPVILVINKADNPYLRNQSLEFFKLGFRDLIIVSAANGTGTGDLLDKAIEKLSRKKYKKDLTEQKPSIKIAFIGKPNVGKSSLINAIMGSDRVITSSEPYTTRDAQDIAMEYQSQPYTLIDTAGVRKRAKIKNILEKISVGQSIASLHRADIAFLVTDASLPLGQQDKTLSSEILDSKTSIIIVANKWDLIPDKDEKTIHKFIEYYQSFFPYLSFAPIIFTSATEKQRVNKILEVAKEAYQERFRWIEPNALDKFLKKIIERHPPARGKGTKKPRLYGLKQLKVDPPEFELLKDYLSDLHESYFKFIERQLRQKFGFLGTPINIKIRKLS